MQEGKPSNVRLCKRGNLLILDYARGELSNVRLCMRGNLLILDYARGETFLHSLIF